ncbi:hypothetical protein STEG23_014746 [Scotinomys teguina]
MISDSERQNLDTIKGALHLYKARQRNPKVTWAMDIINADPSHSRITDLDMDLGSTGYTDEYVPSGSMALRHHHLRWQTRPLAVTGVMDFNSDPDYCRVMDPDMALEAALVRTTSLPGSSQDMK